MLPARFALPPLFFIGSLSYFLPKTAHNLSSYLGEVEAAYFPALAKQHTAINASTRETFEGLWAKYASVKGAASQGVKEARQTVEARTGLKVGDGSVVEEKVGEVKEKVKEAVERIGGETHKLGEKVQDLLKVAEVKVTAGSATTKPEEPPKRLV